LATGADAAVVAVALAGFAVAALAAFGTAVALAVLAAVGFAVAVFAVPAGFAAVGAALFELDAAAALAVFAPASAPDRPPTVVFAAEDALALLVAPFVPVFVAGDAAAFDAAFRAAAARSAMASPRCKTGARRGAAHSRGWQEYGLYAPPTNVPHILDRNRPDNPSAGCLPPILREPSGQPSPAADRTQPPFRLITNLCGGNDQEAVAGTQTSVAIRDKSPTVP